MKYRVRQKYTFSHRKRVRIYGHHPLSARTQTQAYILTHTHTPTASQEHTNANTHAHKKTLTSSSEHINANTCINKYAQHTHKSDNLNSICRAHERKHTHTHMHTRTHQTSILGEDEVRGEVCCTTLQHTAPYCNLNSILRAHQVGCRDLLHLAATRCNTLQCTPTHCNLNSILGAHKVGCRDFLVQERDASFISIAVLLGVV